MSNAEKKFTKIAVSLPFLLLSVAYFIISQMYKNFGLFSILATLPYLLSYAICLYVNYDGSEWSHVSKKPIKFALFFNLINLFMLPFAFGILVANYGMAALIIPVGTVIAFLTSMIYAIIFKIIYNITFKEKADTGQDR